MPMIPGYRFKEIVKGFADSFNLSELEQMLREEMDIRLDQKVGTQGALEKVVSDLLGWMERRGLETELIRAAYLVRPKEAGIRAIYQRYGLSPSLDAQQSGKSLANQPKTATDPGVERTIKNYLPLVNSEIWRMQMAQMEGRVCRVELGDANSSMGTGFLVGPDTLLTNFHVLRSIINDGKLAGAVRFRFDYKKLANGTESDGVLAQLYRSNWLIDHSPLSNAEAAGNPDNPPPTDQELDFALIRLDRKIGEEAINPSGKDKGLRRGWVRVPDSEPAFVDESLFILQHPRREPLKLAMDTQANIKVMHNGLRLRYATTTDKGSSGSPCFNSAWTLIALHHYGDPDFNPTYNQGIPIARIRKLLTDRDKSDALGG
jgi:hypothetical protein